MIYLFAGAAVIVSLLTRNALFGVILLAILVVWLAYKFDSVMKYLRNHGVDVKDLFGE